MARVSVVFDFDGTIALGHGPLDAYTRFIGDIAGAAAAEACREAVRRFDSGDSPYADGYAAIRDAASRHGVDDEVLSAAYLRSRELLATASAPIHPPPGLDLFMKDLSTHATCVVATNAPPIGLGRAMVALGIADSVHEVHSGLGKPAGLEEIIERHIGEGPTLAIGDIWENDLAPAQRLGADTAFVGVGRVAGEPTMRGATLADIYDDVLTWAANHAAPSRTPAPTLEGRSDR